MAQDTCGIKQFGSKKLLIVWKTHSTVGFLEKLSPAEREIPSSAGIINRTKTSTWSVNGMSQLAKRRFGYLSTNSLDSINVILCLDETALILPVQPMISAMRATDREGAQ